MDHGVYRNHSFALFKESQSYGITESYLAADMGECAPL